MFFLSLVCCILGTIVSAGFPTHVISWLQFLAVPEDSEEAYDGKGGRSGFASTFSKTASVQSDCSSTPSSSDIIGEKFWALKAQERVAHCLQFCMHVCAVCSALFSLTALVSSKGSLNKGTCPVIAVLAFIALFPQKETQQGRYSIDCSAPPASCSIFPAARAGLCFCYGCSGFRMFALCFLKVPL